MCCSATISRRDFLKTSALLASTVAILNISPMETLLKEIKPEEVDQLKASSRTVKVVFTGLGLCGCGRAGAPSLIFVKNGRIIRITTARYDLRYKPEELNYDAWKIEARGKIFKPSLKAMNCPFSIAAKKIGRAIGRASCRVRGLILTTPNLLTRGTSRTEAKADL
jgi:hypothetical protein